MGGRRAKAIERVVTHLALLAGSLLFLLPFVWMIATSFKVPREMVRENLRLLPRAPAPQWNTPHLDTGEFEPPRKPGGVPRTVWQAAQPLVDEAVTQRLADWQPQTPGPPDNPPPGTVPASKLQEAMHAGLYDLFDRRMRDEARGAAQRHAREAGLANPDSPPPDSPAVDAGVQALLAEVHRLMSEEDLQRVFNETYRRICLGDVRVRTDEYEFAALHTGDEWEVLEGNAELVRRWDSTPDVQEARIRFGEQDRSVRFQLAAGPEPGFDPATVDRVFISYRSDASWAQLEFEVYRDGLRYRAPTSVSLSERDWVEQELRWPEVRENPLARRLHLTLEQAGPAPEGAPEFAVILTVRKSTPLYAWWAKGIQNYWQSFREVPYARYLATSFSLAILNIVLAIFSCTLVAYGFARLQWPGRDLCFVLLLATMMLPPQVTMIPTFLIVRWVGWYDTLIPLWILSAFGVPFFIFLLRQFFKTIPSDLEDAARIDGCGFLAVYWHVMLPLVKPVIATIAIFTFMASWNNFMGPLIYVNDDRLFPLAMGLFRFNLIIESIGGNIGLIMAASFMMILPVVILFFFLQRYFVQGIALTGTKG